jgi:membrane protease YdiL (CAAX protease family)
MKFLERALDRHNQWWKYIVIFLGAMFGGQLIGSIPLAIVMGIKSIASGGNIAANPENLMDFTAMDISKNLAFGLVMLGPALTLVLTIVLVKALHNRTFSETVNGRKSVRWDRTFFGFGVWFVMMAVYLLIDYSMNTSNYVLRFDLEKFIPLIAMSLILVPLQTTSEELLMRGYLAQGIGAGTGSRMLACFIPSIVFALLHIANPEVAKFGFLLSMAQYLFFGLLFGLISLLDDGIELSIGMHTANNLFLCLFTTHSASALQTEAVFSLKEINPLQDFISLFAIGMFIFYIFYKKYKWNFRIMNKPVNQNFD